jgi:hypothetical protein
MNYNGAGAIIGGGNANNINWTATLLHSSNYNSYAPTLTGGGASGTWGISVTGSAASITGTYGGSLTSSQVTTALGFTPYNSSNPSGYITGSGNTTGTASNITAYTINQNLGTANSPTFAGLTINGAITATGNVTAYFSSDIKFKENIQPIKGAVGKVCGIGGDTYDWTDKYIEDAGGADGYFVTKNSFGVIAQKVQKEFPLAVHERSDGSLAVDYPKLVALAFAAIAELNEKLQSLESVK